MDMCTWLKTNLVTINYLIRFEDRVFSHKWLKQFVERNFEYHPCKQRHLVANCKQNHIVYDINGYFEKSEYVIGEKRITNLNV